MRVTYEEYLNRLAERTIDNTSMLKKSVKQRRNGMEDLYGVPFHVSGDAENPATFYISISPDFVYLERFAFKFVIKSYETTVKGGTSSATVTVNSRSLSTDGNSISPNPHDHTTEPHTHNLINGKAFVQTTSDYWRVRIHGIDITDYLMEQHDGDWIDGEGIYPNNRLEDLEDFYDILDVASMMTAMGEIEARDKILQPEFKKVEIISDAPFSADAYLYVKYPHTNR